MKKLIRDEPHAAPQQYVNNKHNLSESNDGLVLVHNCVVVPTTLRADIIKVAHFGHQGATKTLSLMRRNVWFPDMEAMVNDFIHSCPACVVNSNTAHKVPFSMTPMPAGPWTDLSVDLYGPLRCGANLLVLIDEHSRYPVVGKLSTTSARAVIPILSNIFSLLGIPERVKSDGGPPFNSHQFHLFSLDQGFVHRRITPHWPQANAVCERFMRNLGSVMKKATASHTNWEIVLEEFLRSYRATPHCSTKASPNELMFRTTSSTARLPNISRQPARQDDVSAAALAADKHAKTNMKRHLDANQHVRPSTIRRGDIVLLKNVVTNKDSPALQRQRVQSLQHSRQSAHDRGCRRTDVRSERVHGQTPPT